MLRPSVKFTECISKMQRLNWDDLKLFLAVARAGGLSAASARTGLSPATLGRRMTALERALGAPLFIRRRDGYDVTESGRELLSRGGIAEGAVLSIERWSAAATPPSAVRIASGAWTAAFLATHAETVAGTEPRLALKIVSGSRSVDLLRREADLGIRNRRPTTLGLAGRRLGPVAFAVYGAPRFLASNPASCDERRFADVDWIVFGPPDTEIPSTSWLEHHLRRQSLLLSSDARAVLDAAAAGAGLCILPCFIGDADGRLGRASAAIPDLMHEHWLVSHDEDRHNRTIRIAANRVAKLIRGRRALFAGEKAKAGARSPDQAPA